MFEGMIRHIFKEVKGIEYKDEIETDDLGRCHVDVWE